MSYITVKQVADMLQVSISTVYGLAKNQGLPYARIGSAYRFLTDDVDAWVKSRYVDHTYAGQNKGGQQWQSLKEEKCTGLTSLLTGKEYASQLGLETRDKPKSITTKSRQRHGGRGV